MTQLRTPSHAGEGAQRADGGVYYFSYFFQNFIFYSPIRPIGHLPPEWEGVLSGHYKNCRVQ